MHNTFKIAATFAVAVFAWSLAWRVLFPVSIQAESHPRQTLAAQEANADPQCYAAGTVATGNQVRLETMICVRRDGAVQEWPIKEGKVL